MAFKFQNFDFLHLDSSFSEDELLVRRTARDFVEDNVVPIIEDCFREGRFPRELVPLMGELGFFGATMRATAAPACPTSNTAWSCRSSNAATPACAALSASSPRSSCTPSTPSAPTSRKTPGSPPSPADKKLGCFGLTEPGFGSNPGGMTTRARKSGDEYILNGEKMWITSGSIADVAVIWAKLEADDRSNAGNESIRGFLVETDRPGFSAHEVHGKWSLRASSPAASRLQDVRVPAANLLPGAGGLKSPLMCLNQARYGISWGAIGAAMSCYDTALQYAKARKQFHGQPIAGHQLVQEKLVWMASEISKAQLLSLHVGRLKDAGTVGHQHISMAKRNNVWMALECARLARDILGANGITEDYPIMRHIMNLESVKTYEGTHDIHTLILGQHLTGIAAY